MRTLNDRIIFLIDGRFPMFQRNSKNECHIVNCLSLALAVMKTKIISGENCSVGINFFGVRDVEGSAVESATSAIPEGSWSSGGVSTLIPLSPPSAASIRNLQAIVDSSEELLRHVKPQSRSSTHCPLKQALWTCSQYFSSKDSKANELKRIWIFTNDDRPNAANPAEQSATITVARDCAQAGIELSLWHLNQSSEHQFDPTAFYTKLLVVNGEAEGGLEERMLGGGYDGFDQLMASVRRKQHRKRRLQSATFSLSTNPVTGEDVRVALEVYKTVRAAGKPAHTWLYSRTNEPVKVVSKYFDSTTGAVLAVNSSEVSTYIDVGGNRVPINKADVAAVKSSFSGGGLASSDGGAAKDSFVGLKLLAFIPQCSLPRDLNTDEPYFLFPNDKDIAGSSQLVECLLRDMSSKKLLAVVRFSRLASSPAKLAVLLPQLEQLDEDGAQLAPAGFHLMVLPFAEDIRSCPLPAKVAHSDEEMEGAIEAADALINALPMDPSTVYHKDIESPALQQFYSILEAVALNENTQRWNSEQHDKMRPSQEQLAGAADALEAFKAVVQLGESEEAPASSARGTKRGASAAAPKAKKAKVEEKAASPEGEFTKEELAAKIKDGSISKLTVNQLKSMCRSFGVSATGVKAVLINTLMQYLA